ncbi:MAG: hypothetical protein HY821_19365 [Acidobacteria bacterium]|nr:hypothetical protein [Acidobacteriota bacterium]
MPLPERVQVKLSSEAAEFVSLTPVVVQELALQELAEQILGVAGADAARVRDILKRGSLVSGGSRYRWSAIECAVEEVEALIRALPGPEPERLFNPSQCLRAILTGAGARLEITREAAAQKKLLRRNSFWDLLLDEARELKYAGYLYRERADRFACALSREAAARLQEAAPLLRFEGIARQVAAGHWDKAEWVVSRGATSPARG